MGQYISAEKVNHGCYKASKYEYKWTVSNFKKFTVGCSTTSEDLFLNLEGVNYFFKLILYPHGYNDRVKNYLSIYVKRGHPMVADPLEEMLIEFSCAVLNGEGKKINAKSIKQKLSIESHLGWMLYCRRDFLFDNENTILTDGKLILNCTIEIFENKAIMNAEVEEHDPCIYKSLTKISCDMDRLLLEEDFSDVTLQAGGENFAVHKAILSARSPVFKRMMKSPIEANLKKIEILDITAGTVKKMLLYIYSGKVVNTDIKETLELYYAADKYELLDLKKMCNKILVGNLDVNNAIDIILFGYRHSDNDLLYASIDFMGKNASNIQENPKWISFMKKYPELANMVFKNHLEKFSIKKNPTH